MSKIGIDGRLINQTGVGRYTRNLFAQLKVLDKKNQYFLFSPKISWHSLREQLLMPFWLLAKNFDLVHFTYFSLPVFYPKKFVLTIHDLIPWTHKTGRASSLPFFLYEVKHFLYKLVILIASRRAEKIIAVSRATRSQIIEKLKIDPGKIQVIYQGIEEKFQFLGKSNLNSKEISKNNYFLYVGNAYPHKNLENLIQAFFLVKKNQKYRNFKLVLAGPDDFFYQRLKKSVKLKGQGIIITSVRSDKELVSFYKNAALFVFPSLIEGFGLPGLEAMACGCPVVCSDIPVFREIYGRAPVYFNPGEINSLLQAILKVMDNPSQKLKMVKEGKKISLQYSWEKCARQTLKVYEDSHCL